MVPFVQFGNAKYSDEKSNRVTARKVVWAYNQSKA